MDWKKSEDEFKLNYSKTKAEIKKAVKEKTYTTGSGGSSNIILIRPNYVIKITPNEKNLKTNNDYLESEIYKKLTRDFLQTDKTPHIVGYFKKYILEDIKIAFPKKCLTLDELIVLPASKRNKKQEELCEIKKSYEKNFINKKAIISVLENCPMTIEDYIMQIITNSEKFILRLFKFTTTIRRILFQFMFTLGQIHLKYPNFIHNDLFLRNILGVINTDYKTKDYVQYNHMGKKYYLPANGIYIKINDFGYTLNILDKNSTLENDIKQSPNSSFEINNKLRDVYTFLFDLYDGQGFGSKSVKTIITDYVKNNIEKKKFLEMFKKQIGLFFDYNVIDKIHAKNIGALDWIWNISESKILSNTIKKPNDYFELNLFKFFLILPDECKVVKIYGDRL